MIAESCFICFICLASCGKKEMQCKYVDNNCGKRSFSCVDDSSDHSRTSILLIETR